MKQAVKFVEGFANLFLNLTAYKLRGMFRRYKSIKRCLFYIPARQIRIGLRIIQPF